METVTLGTPDWYGSASAGTEGPGWIHNTDVKLGGVCVREVSRVRGQQLFGHRLWLNHDRCFCGWARLHKRIKRCERPSTAQLWLR